MKNNFSNNFLWGAATASYQVEGAVNEDGKGETVWDRYYHENDRGYTGDIAADHYHRYEEDIDLISRLGHNTYRFSISWARIFPNGYGAVNQKGIDHYNNIINYLIEKNIKPNVTIYHWDMPQKMLDIGGWLNKNVINYFIEYAKFIFNQFGDRVKMWATINEPASEVIGGYITGEHPPQKKDIGMAMQVSHNLNIAHAKVVKLYRELNQCGEIGIVLNPMPITPFTDLKEDEIAAKKAYDFFSRWYINPILSGEYPKEMLMEMKDRYNSPIIDIEDLELLKNNKVDFLGINYYMRRVAKNNDEFIPNNMWNDFKFVKVEGGNYTDWGWEIYPEGLFELLNQIREEHYNIPIYICENGIGANDKFENGAINDDYRIDYIKKHIEVMNYCIGKGIDIRGYYVWGAMDFLSWTNGYNKRYGLIYVDFNTLKRTIKKSGIWYKKLIESNGDLEATNEF